MMTRKILAGIALAALSAGAMAQQSDGGKTDILGRPYVNQTALDAYYQADPYDPLPQFAQLRRDQPQALTAVIDSQDVAVTSGPGTAAVDTISAVPATKTDIFGRPYTGFSALESFYEAHPFAPLPQFWGRDAAGTGTAVSAPSRTNASATTGTNG